MKNWEYMVLKLDIGGAVGGDLDVREFADQLNALGQNGWELVSTFGTNTLQGISSQAIAVLKRPLQP